MKAIAQFIVRVFDLIEAEGEVLRTVGREEGHRAHGIVARLAVGATCLLVSIPIFIAGFALLAAALMWWLQTMVSRPMAAGLTGLAVLAIGASWAYGFRLITARSQP
ncbi:MAG: hypothetical protein JJU36_15935 [Phycisphaeraceae bacterium]|nr:hypothetical protein [Phycisphaeraceae bacterium]